jgi:hypothetical protein
MALSSSSGKKQVILDHEVEADSQATPIENLDGNKELSEGNSGSEEKKYSMTEEEEEEEFFSKLKEQISEIEILEESRT